MENMDQVRLHFGFTATDQKNLKILGQVLLPFKEQFADDFYNYLLEYPETAKYFITTEATKKRKETFKVWLSDLFSSQYDNRYLLKLQRIGKVHVDIGLKEFYVDAGMNFVRELCRRQVAA